MVQMVLHTHISCTYNVAVCIVNVLKLLTIFKCEIERLEGI